MRINEPIDLESCSAPDFDAALEANANLFHLMVLALAEANRPLTMDEVCERLERAGVAREVDDLAYSLSKAWHGLEPVYKDPDGRYQLQRDSLRLWSILHDFDVLPERPKPKPRPEAEPIELAGPDVALELEEINLALGEDGPPLGQLSGLRQTAAVLDAAGRPMSLEDVCEVLRLARADGGPRRAPTPKAWGGRLVRLRDDGLLELDEDDQHDLRAMRREIRDRTRRALDAQRERERRADAFAAYKEKRAAKFEVDAAAAAAARRCIVRVVPDATDFTAGALLDVNNREFEYFLDGELDALASRLDAFDVIAGLDVRDTLHILGVGVDDRHIVDLGPPQKTKTINKRGRKLKLTAEMIIAHTIGKSNPLAEPGTITAYLADGEAGKARRRLAADLRSLFAFYRYGVLHNFVRLRWGFLDEILGVSYGEPGDRTVYGVATEAIERGCDVEVVTGNSAPGWNDPWSRAIRTSVVGSGYQWIEFAEGAVGTEEIQEIRLID